MIAMWESDLMVIVCISPLKHDKSLKFLISFGKLMQKKESSHVEGNQCIFFF